MVDALTAGPAGPYALQAAIAAVHAEAPCSGQTDWAQVVGLFDALQRVAPSPVAELNRAVAVGMAQGPATGLAVLDPSRTGRSPRTTGWPAVRAHLLEAAGDHAGAARGLPGRSPPRDQHARAALPGPAGRPAEGLGERARGPEAGPDEDRLPGPFPAWRNIAEPRLAFGDHDC